MEADHTPQTQPDQEAQPGPVGQLKCSVTLLTKSEVVFYAEESMLGELSACAGREDGVLVLGDENGRSRSVAARYVVEIEVETLPLTQLIESHYLRLLRVDSNL